MIMSTRVFAFLALILGASLSAQTSGDLSLDEFAHARAQVLGLGGHTSAPFVSSESGGVVEISPGEMHEIYFDAMKYEGKSTRVFALIEIPLGASSDNKVPGIVLVHGGGGSAFEEWVKLWVAHGYAAISIAVEGQTNVRIVNEEGKRSWKRHDWAGPRRAGIYGDMAKPIEDQWMYHAVADTILANSLLTSLPVICGNKIGLMGISWGGVIASTVIGIDDRFAFAIPTYGCGHKFDSENQYGRALGESDQYKKVWDPMVRLSRAALPVQWLSWPGDKHFPMDALAASYRAAPGPRLVTLIPGMKHGHGAGWRPADSYAFADSIVRGGVIWARQTNESLTGDQFTVRFETTKPIDRAELVSTVDSGFTGLRNWTQKPAKLEFLDGEWEATATLPEPTTAWFINLKSGGLTASSDFQER